MALLQSLSNAATTAKNAVKGYVGGILNDPLGMKYASAKTTTPVSSPTSSPISSPVTSQSQGMSIAPEKIGIQAKAPVVEPEKNTIAPAQAKISDPIVKIALNQPTNQGLNQSQTSNLDALNAKMAIGYKPTATDLANLEYAKKKGYVYKAPVTPVTPQTPTTPSVAPVAVNPNQPITNAGLLQSLANTSVAGSPVANVASQGLIGTAQTNAGISGKAYDDYQKAIDELNQLKADYAQNVQGIGSSGVGLGFATGQKANLANTYASMLDAAQQKVNQAQAAIGQQLQGVGVQQSGFIGAGNIGNTAQGTAQSGLSTAIGATQPIQLPYGTPLVSPQSGQNISQTGGGVQPTDPFYQTMQSYASLLASNQGSAIPASITGNSVLNAQLLNMAKQINPNFNVNVSQGAGSAQQQVAGTQTQQIQGYQSALQQGQRLQSQFTDLLKSFDLNPSDINKANQGLQVIANNISDPKYQMLQNYINDIANTYAQILTPPGGSATNQTRDIATSMLNSTMSGTGLLEVMRGLDAAANAKISGVATSGGLGNNQQLGSLTWDNI